jgi:hypothetical protein
MQTGLGGKLNVLRAGPSVLKTALSQAGLVVGVAGASASSNVLLIAGLDGIPPARPWQNRVKPHDGDGRDVAAAMAEQ